MKPLQTHEKVAFVLGGVLLVGGGCLAKIFLGNLFWADFGEMRSLEMETQKVEIPATVREVGHTSPFETRIMSDPSQPPQVRIDAPAYIQERLRIRPLSERVNITPVIGCLKIRAEDTGEEKKIIKSLYTECDYLSVPTMPTVTVTIPSLEQLYHNGVGDVVLDGTIDGELLEIRGTGRGQVLDTPTTIISPKSLESYHAGPTMRLGLDDPGSMERVYIETVSTPEITLYSQGESGSVGQLQLSMRGQGQVDLSGLPVQTATLSVDSQARASVHVQGETVYTTPDMGNIEFTNTP